jgi:hypothetical protein
MICVQADSTHCMRAVCCVLRNHIARYYKTCFSSCCKVCKQVVACLQQHSWGQFSAHCLAPGKHPSVRPDTLYDD